MAPHGVHVSVVMPPFTNTELISGTRETPGTKPVEPHEIADAVVFLASPGARAITGQCLDVNCGEYHH